MNGEVFVNAVSLAFNAKIAMVGKGRKDSGIIVTVVAAISYQETKKGQRVMRFYPAGPIGLTIRRKLYC